MKTKEILERIMLTAATATTAAALCIGSYMIGESNGKKKEKIYSYKQIDELAVDTLQHYLSNDISDVHREINRFISENRVVSSSNPEIQRSYYYEGIARELIRISEVKTDQKEIETANFLRSLSGQLYGYQEALDKIRGDKKWD